MGNEQNNRWLKDTGQLWVFCIFLGALLGGVGLVLTIPIAIAGSIYIIWKKLQGEEVDFFGSAEAPRSTGSRIEKLDTMDIPHSGYSAAERRAEYIRRGQSPSGVVDGVYNDTQRPAGVPYNDSNRDWDADA